MSEQPADHSTVSEELPSLKRNAIWTIAGNAAHAASQWGLLLVLARLEAPGAAGELVGRLALGLAVCAPVMMLANLQLRSVQATDARREFAFGDYLGARLLTTPVALLVVTCIALTAGYEWRTTSVVLGVALVKSIESVSDVYYGLFHQNERMDCIATSMLLRGPAALLAFGVATALTRSVFIGVLAQAGAWALVLVCHDIPRAAAMLSRTCGGPARPSWDRSTLRKLLRVSLPLGLVMMLISLNTNIPRYFLEQFHGERALGIFAALAYFVVAGTLVVSSIGHSAMPRLARYYAEQKTREYRDLLIRLLGISLVLGCGGIAVTWWLGEDILALVYGRDYSVAHREFLWLAAAAALAYVGAILGYAAASTRAFDYLVTPHLAVTATCLVAAWMLVPERGMEGAAWTTIWTSGAVCLVPVVVFARIWWERKCES